jgi:hypothetical protein
MGRRSLLWLGALALLASCGQELADDTNDLIVVNEGPCDLTVYVDGREAFEVEAGGDAALADIGYGRHVFEVTNRQGEVVERKVVELAPAEDFYLVLDHC